MEMGRRFRGRRMFSRRLLSGAGPGYAMQSTNEKNEPPSAAALPIRPVFAFITTTKTIQGDLYKDNKTLADCPEGPLENRFQLGRKIPSAIYRSMILRQEQRRDIKGAFYSQCGQPKNQLLKRIDSKRMKSIPSWIHFERDQ